MSLVRLANSDKKQLYMILDYLNYIKLLLAFALKKMAAVSQKMNIN